MESSTSPRKKLKSPILEGAVNTKTSVTCTNVPESLFEPTTVKKHFSKFGRVQKIRLIPKRHMCIIEYDQPISAERAVLNAGAYDGFMFDVTRTKARVRRRSKKDDDPDWVPDVDVEEELSAMSGVPTYRMARQKPMEIDTQMNRIKPVIRATKQSPLKKKIPVREKQLIVSQPTSGIESPVLVSTQTSFSTMEAATELHQLRSRISLTPDEQWRTLDARDRILRAWGGAGSRIKVGGATIGTCLDMCPEKELLHRQAEHQVMTLETDPETEGQLEPWRAVKQYSRSSADQEIPMCFELRPAAVLMRTCAYLLHEIADTRRQVTLADWFHFMWDRFRGIRKDITQQALCCAESIKLVEMCARFHAHCAARLADLEHTQFDQKLNTDNLTKCLQTLKHMYIDVDPEQKPREAEFRGYIALLNLGDANFWWEIKHLPQEIQKSEAITFAIQIFNALDNNNYVRFFRLVKEKATYLQACILLRYFNDVRARALARIVKAYAPRGGSRYPAEELMNALAFESIESMKSFINHYGLRFSKSNDSELSVILDRNQFIEDSDPYPIARAVRLIESKRQSSVGEVIAGGQLPSGEFRKHNLYSSFNKDGTLKVSSLIAEDQGYNTINDSNKDIQALKAELQKLTQGGRNFGSIDSKINLFVKPESKTLNPVKLSSTFASIESSGNKVFSFKPAIPVAPVDVIKNSPEKIFDADTKSIFSFSKPEESLGSNVFTRKDSGKLFKPTGKTLLNSKLGSESNNLFGKTNNENKDIYTQNVFREANLNDTHIFKKPDTIKSVFGQFCSGKQQQNYKVDNINKNVFGSILTTNKNSFSNKDEKPKEENENTFGNKNIFSKVKDDVFARSEKDSNIFAKPLSSQEIGTNTSTNIFSTFNKTSTFTGNNQLFTKPGNIDNSKSIFATNGETVSNKLPPSSIFRSACNIPNESDTKSYSIFQSKNNIQTGVFNSAQSHKNNDVYEFNQNDNDIQTQLELQRLNEEKLKEQERRRIEEMRKEEKNKELKRQEEERRKEEDRRKAEELKRLEEKRKREEERRQEELKKKLEEERKAELKRQAEEEERKFKQRVEKESAELTEDLISEVNDEIVENLMLEELEKLKSLMSFAGVVTDEIFTELLNEICVSELKAEKFWTEKLMKKWFYIWKKNFIRNIKRRNLLEDTPVWLTNKTVVQEASHLRRSVEDIVLQNMNAIHRGYKFIGELRQVPSPEPYNIMEIIKSPLLKRMKQVNYPYDKCFFWKVTLVSPDIKWLYKKIDVEKWLLDVFSDKKNHDTSDSLIYVNKLSWNHLINFAISVSLTNKEKRYNCGEAVEGTNGMLFYMTENDYDSFIETIEETLKHKYPYQIIPVAIVMPKIKNDYVQNKLETLLNKAVYNNIITAFKIFVLDADKPFDSLNTSTKYALKWMAKKYPQVPPLEIDYLKSLCQRYLGNEIWCRLRSENDCRMNVILKDLHKLVCCYNTAVDKLTKVITNEELFNYPSFPLEFKKYLDHSSPYPKPYEFISSNVKNSENVSAVKDIMKQLKLPNPVLNFFPKNVVSMQEQIREYCNQIGWFENPEEVVCKVVAVLPNEFTDLNMPCKEFSKYYEHYDLVDLLNVLVYEKINNLNNFNNRYTIYEKSVLEEYRNMHWLYEIDVFSKMKHKSLQYEDDDLDLFINTKRRKKALDSIEYLVFEDKDCTLVEENIKITNETISKYSDCKEAVKRLEDQIENEKKKSIQLENLLRAALSNV